MMRKLSFLAFGFLVIVFIVNTIFSKKNDIPSSQTNSSQSNIPSATSQESVVQVPMDKAIERTTKKTFGTYVTPANSPISPEKFTGYHTGLDFETLPDEADKEINVKGYVQSKDELGDWPDPLLVIN